MPSISLQKEYDFSEGRRGAVLSARSKTRGATFLNDAILAHFRALSERIGKGYWDLINQALEAPIGRGEKPLTPSAFHKILCEEMTRREGRSE